MTTEPEIYRKEVAQSSDGPGTAPIVQTSRDEAHLVGRAGDDPPDRGDRGPRKAVLLAPGAQQDVELLLAQVGVKSAEAPDLGDEARVGPGPASSAGGGTLGHEGGRITPLGAEFGFPAGEGPARDLEGVERGQKAVGVPESEDSETFLSVFGSHFPKTP